MYKFRGKIIANDIIDIQREVTFMSNYNNWCKPVGKQWRQDIVILLRIAFYAIKISFSTNLNKQTLSGIKFLNRTKRIIKIVIMIADNLQNYTLSTLMFTKTTMMPDAIASIVPKRHVTIVSQVVLTLVYITGVIGNVSALVILFHRDKVIQWKKWFSYLYIN